MSLHHILSLKCGVLLYGNQVVLYCLHWLLSKVILAQKRKFPNVRRFPQQMFRLVTTALAHCAIHHVVNWLLKYCVYGRGDCSFVWWIFVVYDIRAHSSIYCAKHYTQKVFLTQNNLIFLSLATIGYCNTYNTLCRSCSWYFVTKDKPQLIRNKLITKMLYICMRVSFNIHPYIARSKHYCL